MPDTKDCKERMYYIYVEQINMEQQPKLKPYKKRKHPKKFVIIIIIFIKTCINGSISVLIILEEQVQIGTLKYVNKFSWMCKKKVR